MRLQPEADKFREAIRLRFTTQEQAAFALGVAQNTVSRWCAGKRRIPKMAWRLLEQFKVRRSA